MIDDRMLKAPLLHTAASHAQDRFIVCHRRGHHTVLSDTDETVHYPACISASTCFSRRITPSQSHSNIGCIKNTAGLIVVCYISIYAHQNITCFAWPKRYPPVHTSDTDNQSQPTRSWCFMLLRAVQVGDSLSVYPS